MEKKVSENGRGDTKPIQTRANKDLFSAVEKGDYKEVVRLVIRDRTIVNAIDDTGLPILMKAVEKGNREIILFLIVEGADVKAEDHSLKATSLMVAARVKDLDTVK